MTKKTLLPFTLYLLIFLTAGAIGSLIRLYPLRHYVSNDAWDKASLLAVSHASRSIRSDLAKQVRAGLLPADQAEMIAGERLNSILAQDKQEVRQTILRLAKTIDRDNPPKQRFPYLLGADSYFFYGLTQTILQTGQISPQIQGNKFFHPQMNAPDGYWETLTFHAWTGAAIYRVLSFFQPDIDLMFAVSFTPLFLFLLALIPLLVLVNNLKVSKWAALITACCFACVQIFLKRSTFAWYDNDVYSVLFPMTLMMILSFWFSFPDLKRKMICAVSLALTLFLYSLFWQGWVFTAVILIISGGAVTAANRVFKREPITLSAFSAPAVSAAVFLAGISLTLGGRAVFTLFQEGWNVLLQFLNTRLPVWPETYIAVGELRRTPIGTLIDLTGGPVFFIIAVLGAVTGLFKIFKNSARPRSQITLTAIIFSAAGIVITLGAQRFSLLCVTPLTVLFLLGIDDIIRFICKTGPDAVFLKNRICPCLIAAALIIPTAVLANQSMPGLMDPIFNSTWNDALTSIRHNTPPDAIVHSWWPPGHFIKAIADRRVAADGATINGRPVYWLALAFLSATEEEALHYFRLLNNSSNQAVDLLAESGMTDAQAAEFLKRLIHLPEEEARLLAQASLNENTDRLIALTHGNAEASYLLLYNEMIQKFLLFPFVARWDMKKAEEINQNPALHKNIPSSSSPDYIDFLWSMAGGHPRISGIFKPAAEKDGVLIFPNLMMIDLNDHLCRIDSPQYGRGIPAFLIYQDGDAVVKKPLPGADLPYSVVIGKRDDVYEAILAETPLAESLLIRLYFFGDTGLKHIRLVSRHANLTRQMQIDVFKIGTDSIYWHQIEKSANK